MKIYKSATQKFLTRARAYYQSGRALSEMVADLKANIEAETAWLNTDRAKFAKSAILEANRILAVVGVLMDGEYLEGIGGQAVAGLACAWDTLDTTKIREFLTKQKGAES